MLGVVGLCVSYKNKSKDNRPLFLYSTFISLFPSQSYIWKHNLNGTVCERKKCKNKYLFIISLFYLRLLSLLVAPDLQEVSQHYNFISQIPTSSAEVRDQEQEQYRWMKIFQCGLYDREFMKAIKVYRRCNPVPPESRCLLYLPCRSGFVYNHYNNHKFASRGVYSGFIHDGSDGSETGK